MSVVFNKVILSLIKEGKVTSTTVMVNRISDPEVQRKQIDELIKLATNTKLSIGLHLEFTGPNFEKQIQEQYARFKEFFGVSPSHIDIHKDSIFSPAQPLVADFCKQHKLPMRNYGKKYEGIITTSFPKFIGSFKDFDEIEKWIKGLKSSRSYEILFHPGKYDPDCKSSLNRDRERDVVYINKLAKLIDKYGIKKISYLDLMDSDF